MGDLRDAVTAYLAALDRARSSDGQPYGLASGAATLDAGEAERALRAALAADAGWRDRPPTVEEVRAHRKAHPGTAAAFDGGLWLVHPPGGMLQVWALYGAPEESGTRWRPLTSDGDPAPWPEVTP